jgi:hypothetical protein
MERDGIDFLTPSFVIYITSSSYIQDSDISFNGESENNDDKDDDLYNRYEDDIPWEFPLVIAEPDIQVCLYMCICVCIFKYVFKCIYIYIYIYVYMIFPGNFH